MLIMTCNQFCRCFIVKTKWINWLWRDDVKWEQSISHFFFLMQLNNLKQPLFDLINMRGNALQHSVIPFLHLASIDTNIKAETCSEMAD